MSAQHTPGPWFIDTAITSDLEDHVCISAKLHGMLAQVVWRMEGAERTPTCEANARLIAAAPELLEALRMWLDIHDTPAGFAGKYGKAFDDALAAQQLKVDAAASAARAAIAKSTGEAP